MGLLDKKREDIIAEHKDFIYRYTCYICKKKLQWENDDQLSIALIAFNEALETYNPDKEASFLSYAKLVIKNRLIDYFRSEKRHKKIYLEDKEDGDHPVEIMAAWDSYREEIERRDRAYEIARFEELLEDFGISFEDLVNRSPTHQDTRERLKDIALQISERKELVEKILKTGRLPIKEIKIMTGTSRKILETWRKYLLSLIIILSHEELSGLREYIGRGKEE